MKVATEPPTNRYDGTRRLPRYIQFQRRHILPTLGMVLKSEVACRTSGRMRAKPVVDFATSIVSAQFSTPGF
jgi:hypothetical protein